MTRSTAPPPTPTFAGVVLAALVLTATLLSPAAPLFVAPAAAAEQGEADERAAAVAARLMEALGGEEAWADTRFVSFGFAGRRSHWWDRHTGRHRLEGTTQEGERYVVLQDVDERTGSVWLDGEKLEGERAAEMLENAYGAWINDTYWLIAPYKLRDPGVSLAWDREETIDGRTYDVLALSFEGVGLTPGDRYWVWVDRESGLMDRWAYVLEHQPPDSEPAAWNWEGWQRYGEVQLAPRRVQVGGDRVLDLSPIAVPETIPDPVFTSPEPVAGSEDGGAGDGGGA